MDLKRKRDGFLDTDADTTQFCMHARHCWIANNVSTVKMPWDFRLMDNLDIVQKSQKNLFRTLGAMPPLPVLEGSSEGLPDELSRPGLEDPNSAQRLCRMHRNVHGKTKRTMNGNAPIESGSVLSHLILWHLRWRGNRFCLALWSLPKEDWLNPSATVWGVSLPALFTRGLALC